MRRAITLVGAICGGLAFSIWAFTVMLEVTFLEVLKELFG